MPKFSTQEKEHIEEKLKKEGEKLFIAYGLKKVTVDDIVKVCSIAKGSFYNFYESKEHLYMEIISNCQKYMWNELDQHLENIKDLCKKDITKKVFYFLINSMEKYPLLSQMNMDTLNILYRKVSKDFRDFETNEDIKAFLKLEKYGIKFKYDLHIVVKAFEALYISYIHLQSEEKFQRDLIISILLDGIVEKVVDDDD